MGRYIVIIICGVWLLLAFVGAVSPSIFFVGFLFVTVVLGALSGQIISEYKEKD